MPCFLLIYLLESVCYHQYRAGLFFSLAACHCVCACSVMSDSATPWTVAHQFPLSMEFSRQEYWSGLSFPTLGDLLNPLFIWLTGLIMKTKSKRLVTTYLSIRRFKYASLIVIPCRSWSKKSLQGMYIWLPRWR